MMKSEVPITDAELAIVREAARVGANWGATHDRMMARLYELAPHWRALVPADLHPADQGERLVDTYVEVYEGLEEAGGIDSWGASESKTVLANIVLTFTTDDQRWGAVREALDVAQWNMGGSCKHTGRAAERWPSIQRRIDAGRAEVTDRGRTVGAEAQDQKE